MYQRKLLIKKLLKFRDLNLVKSKYSKILLIVIFQILNLLEVHQIKLFYKESIVMLYNNIKQDYLRNLNKLNVLMIIVLEVKMKSKYPLINERTFNTQRSSPDRRNS